jgi:hypothetical protein
MAEYRYACKNPDKYAGDPRRIVARSRWELMYMQALDNSNMVKKWISEPKNLGINYISPLDKKLHTYWPDFLVQYTNGEIEILEVKPLKEALAEKAVSTYDKLSLIKNVAKWTAADRFAKSIGARFRVITEKTLFNKKSTRAPKRSKTTKKSRGTIK